MATTKDIHGWTAVPLNADVVLNNEIKSFGSPPAITVEEIEVPHSSLAKKVITYAKKELNKQTFNHSMRVYFYGRAIQTIYFPTWELSPETYLLTCLLHDIGTTETNISATRMSFEFYGGYLALNVLKDTEIATPIEQAEAVAEAVIRHQDIGTDGKITTLGQLIQLATILDNTGLRADLLHPTTIEDGIKHYPRTGWSSCFAAVIRKENSLKPWAHTTALGEEEFPRKVMGNEIGKKWD